ncbi:MAG: hypothetical protein K5829_02925 [Treponema sp.]|nr:hypothetical protein [Treponema sp.]
MKKIMKFAAIFAAVIGLVGCASTDAKKGEAQMVSSVSHPRTYILDLADSTESKTSTFFSNNGIRQSNSHELVYTEFFKYDVPKAGDTIEVHYKGVSNIDLDGVEIYLMDASAAANYWLGLMSQEDIDNRPIAINAKAGVEFEGVESYVLAKDATKRCAFEVVFFYDNVWYKKQGLSKIGKDAKIEWLKTDVNTTRTEDELIAVGGAVATGPKEMTIDLADASKMWTMQQTADNGVVTGYQAIFDISACFPGDLPLAGDTITVKFKGTSDADVPTTVYASIVENTAAVGWWAELCTTDNNQACVENIVANEPFELSATFHIETSAVEGTSIMLYYKPDSDAVKSSMWKFARE